MLGISCATSITEENNLSSVLQRLNAPLGGLPYQGEQRGVQEQRLLRCDALANAFSDKQRVVWRCLHESSRSEVRGSRKQTRSGLCPSPSTPLRPYVFFQTGNTTTYSHRHPHR